jgi:hypothetical protein
MTMMTLNAGPSRLSFAVGFLLIAFWAALWVWFFAQVGPVRAARALPAQVEAAAVTSIPTAV